MPTLPTSYPEADLANVNLFRHQSLESPLKGSAIHCFRVIDLLPGHSEDPIHCELQIHDINNPPRYEAVSYCWGDSTFKYHIQCNGGVLRVTSNVCHALTQLRHVDKHRLLWMDQVCIDQHNLEERSRQVSIMRLIYQKAISTIIWLGVEDEKTRMVFEFVPRLAEIAASLEASGARYEHIPADHLIRQYSIDTLLERDNISALGTLLEQPWFERVWVVQEVVASTSPRVVQGNAEVSFEDFAKAVLLSSRLAQGLYISTHAERSSSFVHFITGFRQLLRRGITAQLKSLTKLFQNAKSTDPRDKIYAFVGISNDASVTDSSLLSYDHSVSDAFRLWTIHTMRNEKSLDVLSAINVYQSSRSMIEYSWVPDWDAANDDYAQYGTAWPTEQFKASGTSEMDICFRDEQKILGLSGFQLDRIEEVGLMMRFRPGKQNNIFGALDASYYSHETFRSWEATAQVRTRQRYRDTEESIWDAYWQTLLFGVHGFKLEEKDQVRKDFYDFYTAHRKPMLLAEYLRLYKVKYLWAAYEATTLMRPLRKDAGAPFYRRCHETGGRRLIRTAHGYIGLAVYAAQVGDCVYLFKGARIPFMVRSTSEGSRLVGNCYVHGVMNGEYWQPNACERLWLH